MPQQSVQLKNSLDPTYLDQNVSDGNINMSSESAVSIQKCVLVDSSSNPVADINDQNPLVVSNQTNSLPDSVVGTATGTTTTTVATFKSVTQVQVNIVNVITAGAVVINVKGNTSSNPIATIVLPTLAVGTTFTANFSPNVALTSEKVALVIGANFTSGTVSVNVYGN
jgi:hypothetical protein